MQCYASYRSKVITPYISQVLLYGMKLLAYTLINLRKFCGT